MKSKGLAIKLGFVGLLVCLMVSLLAFGCEQPATPTTKPTTPAQTGPKTGGVIKVGYLKDAKDLGYPFIKGIAPDTLMASPCVECLVGWDPKGNPLPLLATEWKVDQATKTVTFTLRKGVKFHDNTDWNAEACKWNLEQYYITEKSKDLNVKSVDIIDDYTIKVTLNAWDVDVLYKISRAGPYWGPMVSPTAVKANGKDWAYQNPVGTGPFKLVSWTRDSKLVYKKFDAYWDKGKPYLDGVEMLVISDPVVQVASLKGKDVDVLWDVPAQNAKELQTAGFRITGTDNLLSMFMLDGAHKDSPFYNIKVRQAVQYAIDSKAIADSVFFGQYSYTNQWAGASGPEYNPTVKGYPYDPTKAKQLLAEAGFTSGFKTTIFCNTEADTVKAMTAVQAMLKVVGIDAAIDAMQEQKWAETMQKIGWPNGMMYRTSVAGDVLISFARHLHGTKGGYPANSTFLNHSAELDKLIEQAQNAADLNAKNALILQMQKIIIDDTAMITPLFVKRTIGAADKSVQDDGFGVNYYLLNTLNKAWKN